MSKEIEEFINSAKSQDIFEIKEYDYTKYDCEVATIYKAQKEKDMNTLVNFWNEKLDNKYFELRHPIYNHITTRAVYSIVGYATIVFMIDKDNKYPWVFTQHYNVIDLIFVSNYYLDINNWWGEEMLNHMKVQARNLVANISIKQALFKNIPYAFSSIPFNPFHFFLEDLCILMLANKDKLGKKFIHSRTFFAPNNMKVLKKNDECNFVLIRASTPSVGALAHCYDYDPYNVYAKATKEALENYDVLVKKDKFKDKYDLTIWFSITGDRRKWNQENKGIVYILEQFSKYFKKIKIFIDGMQGYERCKVDFPDDNKTFKDIVNNTKNSFQKLFLDDKTFITDIDILDKSLKLENTDRIIVFKNMSGYDYKSKICYCSECEIAISENATPGITAFLVLRKPGVLYYGNHPVYIGNSLVQKSKIHKHIDTKYCDFAKSNPDSHFTYFDYNIPPQHIYNLAADVLEELSKEGKLKIRNLKMHRLFVPDVELVKRQYDLQKALNVDLPLIDENNIEYFKKIQEHFLNKEADIANKDKDISTLKTHNENLNSQLSNLNSNISALQNENTSLKESLNSPENREKTLNIKFLEEKVKRKELKNKILEKELGFTHKDILESKILNQKIKDLEQILADTKNPYPTIHTSAKLRIHSHLAYKLGRALIENSKSIKGYIRMPYVLSYIKDKHKKEQKLYNEKIKDNPNLKLPPLESYPDYEAALKEKECITYKLGEALIENMKKGGVFKYLRFYFEARSLERGKINIRKEVK